MTFEYLVKVARDTAFAVGHGATRKQAIEAAWAAADADPNRRHVLAIEARRSHA